MLYSELVKEYAWVNNSDSCPHDSKGILGYLNLTNFGYLVSSVKTKSMNKKLS